MKLQERAEHLTSSDLEDYKGVNSYKVSRIIEYFNSDEPSPYIVCGSRGTGKTLTTMLACKDSGKDSVLIKYQDNKDFEVVCLNGQNPSRDLDEIMADGDVIVLDDVHYIYDDIRFFGLDSGYLLSLLEDLVGYAKKGGRVIIVSEDVFTEQMSEYLDESRYSGVFPFLTNKCMTQYIEKMDLGRILVTYEVNGLLKKFIENVNTNPRGIVKLLAELGDTRTFEHLIDLTRHRIVETNKADLKLCEGSLWREIRGYYDDGMSTKQDVKVSLVDDLLGKKDTDSTTYVKAYEGLTITYNSETGITKLHSPKVCNQAIVRGSLLFELYREYSDYKRAGKSYSVYYMHGLSEFAFWGEIHSDMSYMAELEIAMYTAEENL